MSIRVTNQLGMCSAMMINEEVKEEMQGALGNDGGRKIIEGDYRRNLGL